MYRNFFTNKNIKTQTLILVKNIFLKLETAAFVFQSALVSHYPQYSLPPTFLGSFGVLAPIGVRLGICFLWQQ
jgi:hypothetical protein